MVFFCPMTIKVYVAPCKMSMLFGITWVHVPEPWSLKFAQNKLIFFPLEKELCFALTNKICWNLLFICLFVCLFVWDRSCYITWAGLEFEVDFFSLRHFFALFCFALFHFGAEDWIQGLVQTEHVFYHWVAIPFYLKFQTLKNKIK
jgi:hypothetical protein